MIWLMNHYPYKTFSMNPFIKPSFTGGSPLEKSPPNGATVQRSGLGACTWNHGSHGPTWRLIGYSN